MGSLLQAGAERPSPQVGRNTCLDSMGPEGQNTRLEREDVEVECYPVTPDPILGVWGAGEPGAGPEGPGESRSLGATVEHETQGRGCCQGRGCQGRGCRPVHWVGEARIGQVGVVGE